MENSVLDHLDDTVLDRFGVPINIGDEVYYVGRWSNIIERGRITKFTPQKVCIDNKLLKFKGEVVKI